MYSKKNILAVHLQIKKKEEEKILNNSSMNRAKSGDGDGDGRSGFWILVPLKKLKEKGYIRFCVTWKSVAFGKLYHVRT